MKNIFISFGLILFAMTAFSQNIQVIEGKAYKEEVLFTGVDTVRFQDSNQIKEITKYLSGLEEGKSTVYHKNGSRKEERFWDAGQKEGIWLNWDAEGNLIAEAGYKSNKKDGNWNIWNSEGQKLFEMHYKNGKKIGLWKQWDDAGKLTMEKSFD